MSTPCYYCELPKPQSCAVCVHGEADAEDLRKAADRIAELEREKAELIGALKGLADEFVKVFPIYYYSEPWAHDRNVHLKFAQALIAKNAAITAVTGAAKEPS